MTVVPEFPSVQIGDLTQRLSVTPRAVSFYEEKGLIEPLRDHRNRRVYDAANLQRLTLIRAFRQVGLSLPEIKELLSLDEAHRRRREVARKLEARRHELVRQLAAVDDAISKFALQPGA